MQNTAQIRRALRRHVSNADFMQVDDIPPAPPWVERNFKDGKWTEWTFNPFLAPVLTSLIAGVVIIPPAVIFGSGIGGVLLTILAVLATVAWPTWTFVSMKRNTHTYVSTGSGVGTRYVVEATVMGRHDDYSRARVIAKDSPVRIRL